MTSTDDVAGLLYDLDRALNRTGDELFYRPMMMRAKAAIESQANELRKASPSEQDYLKMARMWADENKRALTAESERDTLNATLARVARVDNSLAKQLSESIATNTGLASERDTLRARLKEAESGIARMLQAWDRLPAGGYYSVGQIQDWLNSIEMKIAVSAARAFIIEGGKPTPPKAAAHEQE